MLRGALLPGGGSSISSSAGLCMTHGWSANPWVAGPTSGAEAGAAEAATRAIPPLPVPIDVTVRAPTKAVIITGARAVGLLCYRG